MIFKPLDTGYQTRIGYPYSDYYSNI